MKDTGERLIAEGNEQNLTYGEHISRYLSILKLVKNKTVVDVASGAGYGSQLIAEHAKSVIGVDYSPEAVEYASKKYPSSNLKYQLGDAHNLKEIQDNSVDVVVSFETIEHLNRPEEFVKQVKRILKPDGVFVVSTPNDDEFIEGNEFHVHQFDLPELKRLINKNFSKSRLYYQGTSLAASLLSETSFAQPTRKTILIDKTIDERPEKAMYFIVVASNKKELPELTENFVSAQRWSTRDYIVRDNEHTSTIKDQKIKISELEKDIAILNSRLQSISLRDTKVAKKVISKVKRTIRKKG